MNRRPSVNRRDQSGVVAVEFALILVPFLVLVFGLIQYGLYFFAAQTGSHAANTAVRELSVGHCTDSGELLALVEKQLGASDVDGTATVSTAYFNPDGAPVAEPQLENVTVGGQVRLTVTFESMDLNFPLLPFIDNGKVTRTVDARVEYVSSPGCAA
jgi:Flp pilus assembly protein TadG